MIDAKLRKRKNRNVEIFKNGRWISTGESTIADAVVKIYRDGEVESPDSLGLFAMYIFSNRMPGSYYDIFMSTKRHTCQEWWDNKILITTRYIKNYFINKSVKDVTPMDIQKWYLRLDDIAGKTLADSTKNKILFCLSTVMSQAILYGKRDDNPCKNVTKIAQQTKKRDIFTDEEFKIMFPDNRMKLVSIWGNLKWACYFMVAKDTGWRPGEIAGLSVDGYYPEKKGIFTTSSVDSYEKRIKDSIKTSFSGGYSYRVGMLSDMTVKYLNIYLKENKIKSGIMFTNDKGEIITSTCSRKHFIDSLRLIGISTENRPPYALRTTFFTNSANKLDESVLKELMGHKQWRSCYDQRKPEEVLDKIRKVMI